MTVDAIVTAGAELFARAGYAHTTTNKIARRAGVSIGSLYQYFPGKDAILSAIFELHQDAVQAAVGRGMEQLADPAVPLRDAFHTLMGGMVAVHEAEPDIMLALSEENLHLSGAHKQHIDQEALYVGTTADMLERRPEVRRGDYLLMARLLVEAIGHLIRWVVHDAPGEVDRAAALEELIQMQTAYLMAPEPASV